MTILTRKTRPHILTLLIVAPLLSACALATPAIPPCEMSDRPVSADVLLQNSLNQSYEACLAEMRNSIIMEMDI